VDAMGSAACAENAACGRRLMAIPELYARRAPEEDVDRINWAIDGHANVVAEISAALNISRDRAPRTRALTRSRGRAAGWTPAHRLARPTRSRAPRCARRYRRCRRRGSRTRRCATRRAHGCRAAAPRRAGEDSGERSAVRRAVRLLGQVDCSPQSSRIDHHTAASSRCSESMVSKSRRPPSHRERLTSHDLGGVCVLVCCVRTVCTCPLTDGNVNLRFVCVFQRQYFAEHYPDYEIFGLCTCHASANRLLNARCERCPRRQQGARLGRK